MVTTRSSTRAQLSFHFLAAPHLGLCDGEALRVSGLRPVSGSRLRTGKSSCKPRSHLLRSANLLRSRRSRSLLRFFADAPGGRCRTAARPLDGGYCPYQRNFAPSGSSQTNSPWITASAAPATNFEAFTLSLPSRLRLWRMYSVTGCPESSKV